MYISKRAKIMVVAIGVIMISSLASASTETREDRENMFYRYLELPSLIKGGSITPHWMADGNSFWFAEGIPDNTIIYKYDPFTNSKEPLFDILRLRKALADVIKREPSCKGLPFETFSFVDGERAIQFNFEKRKFICRLDTYTVAEQFALSLWEDWKRPRVLDRGVNAPLNEIPSPDGRWFVLDKNYNIWLRSSYDGRLQQLTTDGVKNQEWTIKLFPFWESPADVEWSPDSQRVAVGKIDLRNVLRYPLIHWLKPQEEVEWFPEAEAGGPMPQMELFIIEVISRKIIKIHGGDLADHFYRFLGWLSDGSELLFTRLDREFKKWELMAADPWTGSSRVILAEAQKTFLIGHPSMPAWSNAFTLLEDGKKFIWLSERDGWNHLYLYNLDGTLIRRLTTGSFPVVQVAAVDEKEGWVYFTAHAEKEPYDTHLYRVDFMGRRFQRLTEAQGQHGIQFSPSKKFFLDNHSSIDRPPVVELRKASGELVQVLSQANIEALQELRWSSPEEFVVKAADNKTDIHGILYKPYDFDPNRKYPVIEHIYGGPYRTQVPRTFVSRTGRWHFDQALAQLGYIVFLVDGRGTPERGKAFQDVVYHNFGRHEIPDHVAALKQAAATRSYIDLNRVGIYGSSWGGYMTLRALLLAPDVYHVGVAQSAIPDLDSLWLQECYMGLPQNNKEAYEYASNTKIAGNLRGKLLIIKGTSDIWCRLALTLRMAEALIRAGKFFDMLIMPGRSHHLAYTYPLLDADWEEIQKEMMYSWEVTRRYFQEHLPTDR